MVRIDLYDLLTKTQEYIAKYYATALTDEQAQIHTDTVTFMLTCKNAQTKKSK